MHWKLSCALSVRGDTKIHRTRAYTLARSTAAAVVHVCHLSTDSRGSNNNSEPPRNKYTAGQPKFVFVGYSTSDSVHVLQFGYVYVVVQVLHNSMHAVPFLPVCSFCKER